MSVKHDSMIPELVHCHVNGNGNGNGARQMSQVQNSVTKEAILEQHISLYVRIGTSLKYELIQIENTVYCQDLNLLHRGLRG